MTQRSYSQFCFASHLKGLKDAEHQAKNKNKNKHLQSCKNVLDFFLALRVFMSLLLLPFGNPGIPLGLGNGERCSLSLGIPVGNDLSGLRPYHRCSSEELFNWRSPTRRKQIRKMSLSATEARWLVAHHARRSEKMSVKTGSNLKN